MITYQIGMISYRPKVWKFPGGEVGVTACPSNHQHKVELVTVVASIQSSDEIMQLLLLTDALRRMYYNAKINLRLGYVPYGRQDRVCNEGESLSISVFAALINSQNYNQVMIFDPHSDVTPALFNRVVVVKQDEVYDEVIGSRFDLNQILVAPDVGAAKKSSCIGAMHLMPVVYANKTRDLSNGNIVDLTFSGDVEGKDVIVVDDICDKGGTFIVLGEKLKKAGAVRISLFITHGMFNAGTKCLTDIYDEIYTTNTYHQDREGLVDGVFYHKLI